MPTSSQSADDLSSPDQAVIAGAVGNVPSDKRGSAAGYVTPKQAVPPPPPPAVAPAPVGVNGRGVANGTGGSAGANVPPVASGSAVPPIAPLVPIAPPGAPAPKWRGQSGTGTNPNAPPPVRPLATRATAAPLKASDDGAAPPTDDEELDLHRPMKLADFAPSWLISLVIHLVFLLILALFVSPVGEGLGRVLLTLGQSEAESPGELSEFAIVENTDLVDPSDSLTLDSMVDISAFEMGDVSLESPTPDFAVIDNGLGREILPVMPMVGGRSGALRKTLLTIYGGTAETEEAVELGLRWLSRQQRNDGSWSLTGPYEDGAGGDNKAAATAMAMLAFLGAGHTHQAGEYQKTVDKGIRWLVKQQDREGFFAKEGRSHQQSYAQAQSSIVVCELYAMTEDSWLRAPAQLALKYAERAQADKGGWRYQPREAGDTSVTGWYVMALESGKSAGLEVDQSTFYKVREFLDTVAHDNGSAYSYQPYGPATAPMSAEGLLCRQYLGWPRDEPALVKGVARLTNEWAYNRDDPNFYYWYYATQVLHHYGGSPWKSWNNVMREHLPSIQVKGGREAGSWAPQRDRWGSSGGRLYTTCFAIYCLEVYYRHMPLYQPTVEEKAAE